MLRKLQQILAAYPREQEKISDKISSQVGGRAFTWDVEKLNEYYRCLREEISREDSIALARLAALLTFQGFNLSAVGLLMTADWPSKKGATEIALGAAGLRTALLYLLGAAGLAIACFALKGIQASFAALEVTKNEWEDVLSEAKKTIDESYFLTDAAAPKDGRFKYRLYPRSYGARLKTGTSLGIPLPYVFIVIWSFYLLACIINVPLLFKLPDFSSCKIIIAPSPSTYLLMP